MRDFFGLKPEAPAGAGPEFFFSGAEGLGFAGQKPKRGELVGDFFSGAEGLGFAGQKPKRGERGRSKRGKGEGRENL